MDLAGAIHPPPELVPLPPQPVGANHFRSGDSDRSDRAPSAIAVLIGEHNGSPWPSRWDGRLPDSLGRGATGGESP
jgi:hypothetical protein